MPEHRPRRKHFAGIAAPEAGAGRRWLFAFNRGVGEVSDQPQRRAIAHAPMRRQRTIVRRLRIAESRVGEPRHDFASPRREKVAYQLEPLAPGWLSARCPIEDGRLKRRLGKRIEDLLAMG